MCGLSLIWRRIEWAIIFKRSKYAFCTLDHDFQFPPHFCLCKSTSHTKCRTSARRVPLWTKIRRFYGRKLQFSFVELTNKKKNKKSDPDSIPKSKTIQKKAQKSSIPSFIDPPKLGFQLSDIVRFLKPSAISTCFWKQGDDVLSLILTTTRELAPADCCFSKRLGFQSPKS